MEPFEERYREHRVFAALTAAREALASAEAQFSSGDALEEPVRMARILDALDHRLTAADPLLVPEQTLATLAAALDNFVAQIQAYASSAQPPNLAAANSALDGVVAAFPQLIAAEGEGAEDYQAAVSSFRRSVGQVTRNATDEVGQLKEIVAAQRAELEAQAQKITAQDQRIDGVVQQAQAELSALQNRGQTDFNQVIADARTALQEQTTAAKALVADTQSDVTKRADELLASTEERFSGELTKLNSGVDEALNATAEKTQSHMQRMEELLAQAVETVGAIGSTGMSAGYKIVAEREEEQAGRMRWAAIISLILAVAAAIVFAVIESNGSHAWNVSLAKSLVTVPLLLLAAYTARESSRHRTQATAARQVELQLASIGSYLVDLEPAEQQKVKERLADRFFGDPRIVAIDEDQSGLPSLPTKLP